MNNRILFREAGLRPFITLLLLCAAALVQAAPPVVSTVPVDPNDPIQPHDIISGKTTTLKGAVDAASVGATWTWNPGDGSASISGVVNAAATSISQMDDIGFTPHYAIWIPHSYTGTDGDVFLATLTVTNAGGESSSAVYRMRVRTKTVPTEVNTAIDEALWFMHRNLFRFNGLGTQGHGSMTGGPVAMGKWDFVQTGGTTQASSTAAALNAFEANGYLEGGPASSPYTETVQRAMRYVIASLTSQGVSLQTAARPAGFPDDPDTNGNGIGVYVNGAAPTYQGGMVMDAIIASGTPDAVAVTGPANVIGRTYGDIIQDMVDWYAWAQSDNVSHGGWQYSPFSNNGGVHDNSASGWGAIGLVAAEDIFGSTVPQWVKDRNETGLEFTDTQSDTSDADGQHGYGSIHPVWGPYGTTSAAMVQMTMDDIESTTSLTPDERWIRAENFFRRHFNDAASGNNFKNYYYGMFNFAKAMRTALPDEVVVIGADNSVGCGPGGGTPGCSAQTAPLDWYLDPAVGLARVIIDYQTTSGVNIGLFSDRPGNSQGSHQDEHNTPWATQILTRTLFQAGPVARAAATPNPGAANSPISFDASGSFHQDPARSLILYEWDFDNDGIFDSTGVNSTSSFDCPTLPVPCSYTVRLRVTDNNVPARFSDDLVVVEITIPPRPPTANAGGPYLVCANEEFSLDGSGSSDVDEGTSESGEPPFDTITRYDWELDGISPFDFDEASGVAPLISFPLPGSRDIGLQVADNTSVAFPTAAQPDLTDRDFTSVSVGNCGCIGPITARTKPGKAQLVWNPVAGAASYDVLRSVKGSAELFEVVAVDHQTDYATWLDRGLTNGTTYWYRVVPKGIDGMPICAFSQAVAATPQLSRRARTEFVAVPDVVGLEQSLAAVELMNNGLAVGNTTFADSVVIAAGAVISTDPSVGSSVAEGSAVDLVVSLGPPRVAAPDVTGQSQVNAEAAIIAAGLVVGDVTSANSDTVLAGHVISQDPPGGVEVVEGSAIALQVSLGPVTVAVPNVVGETQADGEAAILAAELAVGDVTTQNSDTIPAGVIISQDPGAGTSVVLGTTVDLLVSLGPVTVAVPNVIGLPQADAEAAILAADLGVGTIGTQNSTAVTAGNIINQSPGAGDSVIPGTAVDLTVSLGPLQVSVPDVVGLSQADAEAALVAADLGPGTITEQNSLTVAAGQVISQNPAAGVTVDESSLVALVISLGPVQVTVPSVTGLAQATAEAAIAAADLVVGSVSTDNHPTVPTGDVISQNPAGGTVVDEQSTVDIVVSLGPVQVTVPSILGESQASAEATIVAAGLTVGVVTTSNSTTVPAGEVITQDPAPGAIVDEGSAVNFVVSLGPVQVDVPDVGGLSQAAAEAAITGAGLAVGTVTTAQSDTVPIGDVISQDPLAGTTVDEGSSVNLLISTGDLIGVPDVVGLSQAAAEAAIVAGDLTVGTVNTATSLTVPSGNVISQDPAAGTAVSPASAVNLVVSIGPAQVTVPDVVGLSQAAAETAIAASGLTTGTVIEKSSATVAAGDVISQDPIAGSTVDEASSVNLVVSNGTAGLEPASMTLALSTATITAEDDIDIIPTVLNGDGDPIVPLPPISYTITFIPGEAAGTLPTEAAGIIATSVDTRGLYTVSGTVDTTTITASADFLVYRPAAESGQKALYGGLSTSVNSIAAAAEDLAEALESGDFATAQTALDSMRAARNTVDLTAMRRSTVFAPEGGFLPSTAELTAAGFPSTADDATLQIVINNIVATIEQTSAFYANLNPASATDDEAVMAQLNDQLQSLVDQLDALNPTVHGWVAAKGLVNRLYAVSVPRHLHAVTDRYEDELVSAGLGIVDISTPDAFYRHMMNPLTVTPGERLGPEEYYLQQQRAFFSLGGMSAAVNLQMKIIQNVYVPIMHDIARNIAILVANDLLNAYVNNMGSPDLITGGSLSFHIFNASNSVIEIAGVNPDDPTRADVFLVGSKAVAAVEGLLTALDPGEIEDLDDVWNYFEGIVDAINSSGEAFEEANQIASDIFPSCLFSSSSACVQLVYPSGFNSVVECSGFICFPQAVLVLVHNLDTGTWGYDVFSFSP